MASILRRGLDRLNPERLGDADQAHQLPAFTFSDMASQGDAYVRTIRSEATKIVQDAKAEADRIRKKADADGQAAAKAAMSKLLDERMGAELATLRPALESVVAEIDAARGEWLSHWRQSAIGLAVAIAEKIVRRELNEDPVISQAWLAEALELAAGASDITVRVAPVDLENLRSHAQTLAASMSGVGEARFVADPSIEAGGCRVETRHGSVDQQLKTQLDRLFEELA